MTMKASIIRLALLGSMGVFVMNILLIGRQNSQLASFGQHQSQPGASFVRIGSDFFSSFSPVEETVSHHALRRKQQQQQQQSSAASNAAAAAISSSTTTTTTTTKTTSLLTTGAATVLAAAAGGDDDRSSENIDQQVASRNLKQQGPDGTLSVELPLRYPKTLMGIFSSDGFNDSSYRKRHRTLLQVIWKDPRTCTLAEYRRRPEIRDQCQLIYTFIIGGNVDADAPTELLENRPDLGRPLVLDQMANPSREDVNADDVTLLNIRENMNDGKSPTFFYFATTVVEEFGNIDYVMKLDADAILHLHDFFLFAHEHLPPAPYNTNIFAGALRDKAGWAKDMHPPQDMARFESFWGNEFEGVHLYLAGQCYLMSYDLAKFVAEEAPFAKTRIAKGGYLEGHEDHDVSSMAFHSPTPVHMITIGKSQRFWEHPVKGQPRWIRIEKRERARMNQQLFEGKSLRLY